MLDIHLSWLHYGFSSSIEYDNGSFGNFKDFGIGENLIKFRDYSQYSRMEIFYSYQFQIYGFRKLEYWCNILKTTEIETEKCKIFKYSDSTFDLFELCQSESRTGKSENVSDSQLC